MEDLPAMADPGSSDLDMIFDVEKDPDPASLEAAMRVPSTAWLGPVAPLLRKLHPGQSLPPDLLSADEIRLLKVLFISLKDMSEDEDASFMVRWWMKIVRELCYDTDDRLDEVINGGGRGAHHDFSASAKDELSELIARAKDASERRKYFQWSAPKAVKPAERGEASVTSPGLPVRLAVHVEPPKKLVQLLALDDQEKTLKVIPITGCAGDGKTTAARALYHRQAGKFQCRAFVTVSPNPHMRGFLTSMLSQLKAPWIHGFPDVPDLIDAINKHLQGKRYFIVIDDLWTASVWNIISRAFPHDDSCSRIITTTQIDDVALACCSYDSDNIFKMEPCNDYESRKLFFGRLFGSEDGCPTDIKEASYEIIRKCGGLPLVIANIASLLASQSNNIRGKWKHIQDFLSFNLFVEEKGRSTDSRGQKTKGRNALHATPAVKDILGLPGHGRCSSSTKMIDVRNPLYSRLVDFMYKSLPPRLRTCLLYLSMYAQGCVIKKDELVKLWLAEGFLGAAVEGEDMEEIAGGYFVELVSRGMIQAVDTDYNGEVLSCSVHQIVLDFIRHKSKEENFVISVDYFQSTLTLPDRVRRLSVQFGGVKGAYIPENIVTSHVRSLIFWGFFKCMPPIMDYDFLRVLVLHIWADREKESFDLSGIGKLFLLKYIKIESNTTINLPEKIQRLKHLETLQVDARLSAVPSDIVSLPRLLYLSLPSEVDMPSGIRGMTCLLTLGYFDLSNNSASNVTGLGHLTHLRGLHLTCAKLHTYNLESNIHLLGSILMELISLECLTLAPADSSHINTLADAGASSMGICFDGLTLALQAWEQHRKQARPWELEHREVSSLYALQRLELSRHCCFFSRLPRSSRLLVNICILKVAVVGLWVEDIDMLKGLSALTALTLYIQTAPSKGIVIKKEGFEVLTYFKFMCAAPCLSFVPGAMPQVQKLKLGFNSNEWRSHTFETVGFHHLTGLTEVSVKFGAWDAEEFDIKAAESALEAAVRNPANTPTIRVQCVDVIFCAEEDKRQEIEEEHVNEQDENRYKRTGPMSWKPHAPFFEDQGSLPGFKIKPQNTGSSSTLPSVTGSRHNRRGTKAVKTASQMRQHHAPSVDLVTGAFGSLLPKLLDLLEVEVENKLQRGIKKLVDSLYKDLEALQAALREVAKLEQDGELEADQRDEALNAWARDARDLSYDAEDIVDSSSVGSDADTKLKDGIETLIPRTSALLSRGKAHHEIFSAIDDTMGKAQDLAARRERYKVGVHNAANPNAAASFGPPLSALYEYPKDVVGIDAPRDEVIRMLIDESGVFKKLKIVSILGMGGLGKTTLLKAVYDKIRVQYEYTAFVSVSRDPDMRRLFMDILLQIHKHEGVIYNLAKCDEDQLFNEVWVLLANKRYLIVFDDICDVKSWERIKRAMVDSGRGSGVVTSTEVLDVAKTVGEVYELNALSGAQSKELFNARLCYGEKKVPNNLPEVSEKLLSKCGGVPLAIITMARLLVRKPMNDWSKVYKNIGFGSEVGSIANDNTRRILLCTYYDLPYHLRACLLHLHNFPVNCIIKKETLIWKWAAEDLIFEEPGTGLFELGEGYLKELICRNLVMPAEDDLHPGKVIGCQHVHDLVLDMICSLSTEENIVTVLDGSKQQAPVESKARRLSVQKWAAEQGDPLVNIRPERLRSFNTTGCHFSTELSVSRFELLRVIAMEECTFIEGKHYNLMYIGILRQLRYLGLYNTPIEKLPEEIGDLIYLQTLDLRGTRVFKLPRGIVRLRKLKCLRADGHTSVPDWIGNLTSLEELRLGEMCFSVNFVKELGKLTELREIETGIQGLDESQNKDLVQSMRKLEKIQVLRLMGSPWLPSSDRLNWGDYDPPRQLREFHLGTASLRLPAWINVSRVPMLSYLSVYMKKAVEEKDLENLGRLPELISLELLLPSDVFPAIKGDGAFPKLRRFHTSSTFRFLPGAMLKLEFLHFKVDVAALKDANVNFDDDFVASTLKNLPSLQKVEVEISSTGDVEVIYEALKRAMDEHPNSPSLHVIKSDQEGTAHRRLL